MEIESGKLTLIFPEPDMATSRIRIKGIKSYYKERDVIKALKAGKDILWKYPESGLHPSNQLKIAELLMDLRERFPERKIVIETFSEIIFMRIGRRIKEYSLFKGMRQITHNNIQIFCVGKAVGTLPIKLNRFGDFITEWPRGWFPEALDEI